MLAVQRPSMGSSKPTNDMPFGYSFDSSDNNFPYPPPPPAAGAALLDDNDSKNLEHFFDGFGSDEFNDNYFFDSKNGNGNNHHGDMFPWSHELPPTFMGTSSSFGQQTHPPVENFGIPAGTPTTSADVFAATALLQGSRSQSMVDPFSAISHPPMPHTSMQPTHHGLPTHNGHARKRPEEFMSENFYADIFASNGRLPREPSKAVDIRWGSDAAFANPSFVAPPGQESVDVVERNLMQKIECFEPVSAGGTGVNTRHTSPVTVRRTDPAGSADGENREQEGAETTEGEKKRKMVDAEKPKKRRKEERKSSATRAAEAKAARENLTEEQKRENHIRSEQKRRTLIKEGFEDLGELVPDLRGGGFSKSAVLTMAGDWLEDLLRGNEELTGMLARLEGR